jgi:hypothetical protein
MLIRSVKRLRFVTRAVTVIQFAAVTFVPIVHPFLHHETAAGVPTAGPLLPAQHTTQHCLERGDECLICSAQPGIPQAVATGLAPCPDTPNALPLPASETDHPVAPSSPANRVRAPPQALAGTSAPPRSRRTS